MLASIGDYYLANGTQAGGRSLTGLRLVMHRIFDVVIPIGEVSPVLFDRNKRRTEITFNIQRVQATIKDAENYINIHEATIPRTGDVKLIVGTYGGTSGSVALIVNGALLSHELIKYTGKFTEHSYQIVGSPIFAPSPGADFLVTEGGDRITTETGDKILVE